MTNAEHIQTLNAQKRTIFEAFIQEVEEKLGWSCIITTSYRSIEYQNKLHILNKKNAAAGLSAHNYGFAIDCNFVKNREQLRKTTQKENWIASGIIDVAKKYGLRWGGEFTTYYDPIHFDCVQPGYTAKWFAYIKKTYPKTWQTFEANKTNWKFYNEMAKKIKQK